MPPRPRGPVSAVSQPAGDYLGGAEQRRLPVEDHPHGRRSTELAESPLSRKAARNGLARPNDQRLPAPAPGSAARRGALTVRHECGGSPGDLDPVDPEPDVRPALRLELGEEGVVLA